MVPCECGLPFDDLADWKAHSTATGHCCICKCRKPASAPTRPGFRFEEIKTPTSSKNHYESWNACPTFQVSPRENIYSPSLYGWGSQHSRYELPRARDPAATRLQHPLKGHSPLHESPVSQPAQGHHPLSHLYCNVQATSMPPHVTPKSASKRKPYSCSHCKRAFRTAVSLWQHIGDSHPDLAETVSGPICDTCNKSFPGQDSLEQHQRTVHTSQFRCCDCEKDFISEQALDQHLNDKFHPKIHCQICEQVFASKLTLNRHVVTEHHASANPKRNLYRAGVHGCFICQQKFDRKSDLDRHLTSLKHHPLSDLPCIASDKCKRRFISPSALLHHLESGTCRSGIDRHAINNLVRDNDVERIISSGPVGQSLLESNENPSESSSSSGTPVFTPTSSVSSSPVPDIMMENTMFPHVPFLSLGAETPSFTTLGGVGGASIPSTLEILTPSSSRKSSNFDTVGRLPSSFHTNLSSHELTPTLFHCPTAIVNSTPHSERPRTFTTLSGLAQHIESGACGDGLATLKKAMEFVQERLEKMGLGSIRLLR